MTKSSIGAKGDIALAFFAGALLATMIYSNGILAKYTAPLFSSWVAHGLGTLASLIFVFLGLRKSRPKVGPIQTSHKMSPTPWWYYLGGLPGALIVILTGITVNSEIALSGSISLMLVGQIIFGVISDSFGLFGTPKRKITFVDLMAATSVFAGSLLIIFAKSSV